MSWVAEAKAVMMKSNRVRVKRLTGVDFAAMTEAAG